MKDISKVEILDLIANNRLNDAISICLDRVKFLMANSRNGKFKKEYKTIVIFSERMQNITPGALDKDEQQLSRIKITNNFIDWIDEIDNAFWRKLNNLKTTSLPEKFDLFDQVYHPKLESNEELNIFRFRAECSDDVDRLEQLILERIVSITRVRGYFPDILVELVTDLELDELRDKIRNVVDGHVMLQTVAFKDDYTGERDYDLD